MPNRTRLTVGRGTDISETRDFTGAEDTAKDAEIQADLDAAPARAAAAEIIRLETLPRRTRERLVAMGDQYSIDEDALVATERAKL